MKSILTGLLIFTCFFTSAQQRVYGLNFNQIPASWDQGIPIGNGWLGAVVWQKDTKLRLSIDRVDLWDDRPMAGIDQLKFSWVKQQFTNMNYAPVQKIGDDPYMSLPAPTKIPGAAIEFDIRQLGEAVKDSLDIHKAVNTIKFKSGISFTTYVHATQQAGFFCFEGLKDQQIVPVLIGPVYQSLITNSTDQMSENSLTGLGYANGSTSKKNGQIILHQPTLGKNYYEVLVQWKRIGNKIEGSWTITNGKPADSVVIRKDIATHYDWWKNYWSKSSVILPDQILDRQYQLDMYKFGCVVRADTPPITLQSIWTADNGTLPPWKGDLHFDLNVEMSYWPGYAANHLDLTASLTNWLWKVKDENKKWTKSYFDTDGLNVPGVSTISGKPMGGWIQYAMSPTTSAWLSHHFYLQWKYGMDGDFLKDKCYPYLTEVEKFLKSILVKDQHTGRYQLPLSSSPEYKENSRKAWFLNNTNFDLSLLHNFYLRYAEISNAAGNPSPLITEREKEIQGLDFNKYGLSIAKGTNLSLSHRHLSHMMAIYPLCLLNKDVANDKVIIENSIGTLEQLGTGNWYGFTFPWAAAVYAQVGKGDSAVVNLKKFCTNFSSLNSFNLNGDQKGGEYSDYTDSPFTLETNFGFAEGVHQLLLQSAYGYIDIFPALPESWKDVSFKNLRSEGAFLISAQRKNGLTTEVRILSEKGGLCRLKSSLPAFTASGIPKAKIIQKENGILEFQTSVGQVVILRNL